MTAADADYQAFVKVLEEGPKAVPTAQAQLEAQEAAHTGEASGPVVTALMAFLQKKYESTPFTGRRGSRASRKRDGAKLASLLEEVSMLDEPADRLSYWPEPAAVICMSCQQQQQQHTAIVQVVTELLHGSLCTLVLSSVYGSMWKRS